MPKNYRAYLNRGICKEQLKDLDGAVADYTKTIELFPSHPDAYNNRGGIRKSKSDLDGALADFNKVIEVAGKDLKPYHFLNRGLVWQDKKEWNRVVEDFTQALALDPKFVNAYIRRGMVQQELKNADAAIADYNKVLEIDPGNTSIYLTQV
jgi:tetratricopeptide (TPR) repeat protein